MQAAESKPEPEQAMPDSFHLHIGRLHPDSELRRMFGSSMRMDDDAEADGARHKLGLAIYTLCT